LNPPNVLTPKLGEWAKTKKGQTKARKKKEAGGEKKKKAKGVPLGHIGSNPKAKNKKKKNNGTCKRGPKLVSKKLHQAHVGGLM